MDGRLMANEKITSLDVARRAGVSQSAVSRVFTPGASVSKHTVEKVRRAAAELGYRPNVLARSLITGRSRIIGLVVAYLENYFYPVVERLSVALQEQGYHVLVFMAAPTVGDVQGVVQEILDYRSTGSSWPPCPCPPFWPRNASPSGSLSSFSIAIRTIPASAA